MQKNFSKIDKFKKTKWWGYLGLNQGPIGYEPTALTTELYPQKTWRWVGDSNPGGTLQRPTGLANPPLQPLE
jgi:hypothetical protein